MRFSSSIVIVWFLLVGGVWAQSSTQSSTRQTEPQAFDLMPMPSSVRAGAGALPITQTFAVRFEGYREPRLDRAAARFLRDTTLRTGLLVAAQAGEAPSATLVIHANHASKPVQDADEDESYVLDVSSSVAKLTAPNPLGILRGLQTFLQLIQITPTGFAATAVHIEDTPRFPWRGLMIDVSRHFIYMDTLKRNVDAMAVVKMNVLHLHLSDDQGFRIESKEFPKLSGMGSDGQFYTQAEIRDLLTYANDRGIRVVPEFDIPGHSIAWFVGYPALASGAGPYQVERRWGIFDPAMDPTREETYKFIDKFIGEMAAIFPDHYFHIGGDEVNGKQWDANPKIQEFMRARSLKNNESLQQYFTLRVQKLVNKHHKEMVGWDEVLSPGMPENIVIQSWRGQDSLAESAKQGYRGLLSNGYYLDAMSPAAVFYAVDPMANGDAGLTPEQKKLILGGEACMWQEYDSDENLESRIWPRAAAIAERLWSPQNTRDVASMYARLHAVDQELQQIGLRDRSSLRIMQARIAGTDDISALRVLADALEPASLTIREKETEAAVGVPTSQVALNQMVDAVAPESEVARQFSEAVSRLIASDFKDAAAESYIRSMLTLWRDNDSQLRPMIQNSYLLKDISPISQNLSSLGAAGVQALDLIDKGQRPADSWRNEVSAVIQESEKPTADVVLAVAPAIQTLVDAAAKVGANK